MDTPIPKSRLRIELLALATLAIVVLVLFPQRPTFVDVALALVGLVLLGLNINFTKTVVWGQFPPSRGKKDMIRACLIAVFVLTLPLMLVCLGTGLAIVYASHGWDGAIDRISNWHILVAICLFVPWALLQQTLFQFYLLGRLLSLLPSNLAITCTGIAFGIVHLPDVWITLATAAVGIVWTYLYYRYRVLVPLALSHASLGSTFYYWVYGRDLFEAWQAFLH